MKRWKPLGRRVLSLLLCLIMMVGMLQVTALADETGSGLTDGETVEQNPDADTGDTETGGGDDADGGNSGPHGGTVENIDNGTRETWDNTGEDGVNKAGSETKTETKTETPLENGSTTTTEANRDLTETTTNPTVTNPDGSTVTTGTTHTDGDGSTTETKTTTTDRENNPTEPVPPSPDEIAEAGEGKNPVQTNPNNQFVKDESKTDTTGNLPSEDLSEESDSWLGKDGVTVTMTPGKPQGYKEINANVGNWEQAITDKINAVAAASGDPYIPNEKDQIPVPDGSRAYQKGDTVTIVTPTYDENQKLTGFTTKTIVTTEKNGERQDLINEPQSNPKDPQNPQMDGKPVREEATTTYEFTVPNAPEAGTRPDGNGNTVETKVEELLSEEYYLKQADGSYILSEKGAEGAAQVVVGYKVDTVTKDASGKEIGTSSRSDWGIKNETVTTPIRTHHSAEWDVLVEHYVIPVTRAVTTNNYTLTVDLERGGQTCQVWGQMGAVANNNKLQGEGKLEVDLSKQPNTGTTNTATDLYHRAGIKYVYEVTADSLNIRTGAGTNHPIVTVDNKQQTLKNGDKVGIIEVKDGWGKIGANKWVHLGYGDNNASKNAETGKFLYLGENALESAIRVNGKNKDGEDVYTWQPHQFIIYDDKGSPHYVLCADFEVSPSNGAEYKGELIDSKDTIGKWSADAGENKEIAQKVQAIAINGYWGTASGTGSLDSVKQMMKAAIKDGKITGIMEKDVEKLTDGMALTATQAAIWSYATSGQPIKVDDPFGQYNENGDVSQDLADKYFKAGEEKVAKALYDYLRSLGPQSSYVAEDITIKKSEVTVKNVVTDGNGNPVVVTPANEENENNTAYKYKTDVSFVLETTPSQLNDDLLVTIKDANDPNIVIGTYRLAGDSSKDDSNIGKVTNNGNGKYTIQDVVLAEGVCVTLNLHGTQLANKSAYLITAQNPGGGDNSSLSQTFVGVKDQQRKIDVSVNLTFNVREPVATLNGTTETKNQIKHDEYEKHVELDTDWSTYQDEVFLTATSSFKYSSDTNWELRTPAPEIPGGGDDDDDDDDDDDRRITENDDDDDDDDEIPDQPTPLGDRPGESTEAEGEGEEELPEEDVPLAEMPEEEEELPEDEVPLADVPTTGDISLAWYAVMSLSAAGLFCLQRPRKREDEDGEI